jgi:hypothetical protein
MPRKIAFAKMHGARVSGSLPHASLKNVAHSKFTADLFDIDRLSRPFETQPAGLYVDLPDRSSDERCVYFRDYAGTRPHHCSQL